jgi:hypothetical protein
MVGFLSSRPRAPLTMQRKYEPRHPSGVLCKYRGALNTTSAAPSAAVKATLKKSITVLRLIIATFLPALAVQIRFQIAQNYSLVFYSRDFSVAIHAAKDVLATQ